MVVVFDNLDRVQQESAVEMLATIKTFLDVEGCVYIVPCDEAALTEHVRHAYASQDGAAPDARPRDDRFTREFLRRFFQLTIRLPQFGRTDYEHFIDKQVELPARTPSLATGFVISPTVTKHHGKSSASSTTSWAI